MSRDDLRHIQQRLLSATPTTSDREFKAAISELEDRVLASKAFPDEYAEFFIEALSNPSLFSKPGAWRVPVSIYNDRDKLTPQQQADLIAIIVESYPEYRDEKLCLTTADLVARSFPVEAVMTALGRMGRVNHKHGVVGVQVGLQALAHRLEPNDSRLGDVKRLHQQATDHLGSLQSS